MNTELIKKFAPLLIGLGVILPFASYFLFFSGGGTAETKMYDGGAGPDAFPPEDATITVAGKQVHLSDLRADLKSTDAKTVAKATGLLGEAHDLFGVPELFRLMESPDVGVRGRAAVAVEKILGKGAKSASGASLFDPSAAPDARKKSLDQLRKNYQAVLDKKKGV